MIKRFLPERVSTKTILISLICILAIHLIVLFFYTGYNWQAQQIASHARTMQKIFNTINVVQGTPKEHRAKAIEAYEDSALATSVSTKPEYDNQFHSISYLQLQDELHEHPRSFEFSLKLADDQWLNFNATFAWRTALAQIVLVILECFVIAVLLIAFKSIDRFKAPLEKFKKIADQLGVEDVEMSVIEYGPALVQETASAMNHMQQRIQHLLRDRSQMIAALSHDLRTPITRIKLRTQFIEDPVFYEKTIKDLDEMESMIAETLEFVKEGASREEKVRLDIIALLSALCNDYQDSGEPLKCNLDHRPIAVHGRPLALRRTFMNLINNAIKYGKEAEVSVCLEENQVMITIDDSGSGIPEAEMEKVFDPFYRGERSRSRETGGIGLGLALVKNVLRNHSGTISLENKKPNGLRVIVKLPI